MRERESVARKREIRTGKGNLVWSMKKKKKKKKRASELHEW